MKRRQIQLADRAISFRTILRKIILTIEAGSNSKRLRKGSRGPVVIDNAREFENYLLDKGLSGRIQIGEHEVDSTMDFETIAKYHYKYEKQIKSCRRVFCDKAAFFIPRLFHFPFQIGGLFLDLSFQGY